MENNNFTNNTLGAKFKVGDLVKVAIDGPNSHYLWFCFKKDTIVKVVSVSRNYVCYGTNYSGFVYDCVGPDTDAHSITQQICEPDLEEIPCTYAGKSILAGADRSSCFGLVGIKNIDVNAYKRIVTVVFENGHVEQVHCSEEDEFDVRIGVALAIANATFGSKNKFHKFVDKTQKFVGKEPKKVAKNKR